MMARSTRKTSSKSARSRTTTRRKASSAKKTAGKKSTFQKLLTAEGWKRLMMGKMRKRAK